MSDLKIMVPFKVEKSLHNYNGDVHYFFENQSGCWSYHCGDLNPRWGATDPMWAKAAVRQGGKEVNWLEVLVVCGTSRTMAKQLAFCRK